jgi:hypothetical protein
MPSQTVINNTRGYIHSSTYLNMDSTGGIVPSELHGTSPSEVHGISPSELHGISPSDIHGISPSELHGISPILCALVLLLLSLIISSSVMAVASRTETEVGTETGARAEGGTRTDTGTLLCIRLEGIDSNPVAVASFCFKKSSPQDVAEICTLFFFSFGSDGNLVTATIPSKFAISTT